MKWIAVALFASLAQAQGKPVEVAPVVEREVASGRSFVASVAPARRVTVGAEAEGLVTGFFAREGRRFEHKIPLAQLRTEPLDVRLAAARAELKLRAEELAELKNGSRPAEKEAARARLAQAKADLDLRVWKRGNVAKLFQSGSVTEDELQEADLALKVAQAKVTEEQAALQLVLEGPRQEKIDQAQARHDAQKAEVDRLLDDRQRHTILAPFAGYVVIEHSQVGAWLKKGDPVAEFVELDNVDVVIPVLEDFISGIKPKMDVSVTVDALPGQRFDGVVTAIVPQAEARARTFPVKVRIKNRIQGGTVLLKAGMFARVTLAVGEKQKALMVPKDALVLGRGPMPIVYVVNGEDPVPVPVRLGVAYESLIQVIGDIRKGQQVVTRGNERIFPGDKVRTGR